MRCIFKFKLIWNFFIKKILPILSKYDHINIIKGLSRAENYDAVENEILKHKPDKIISMIGRMYGDNIYSIKYLENNARFGIKKVFFPFHFRNYNVNLLSIVPLSITKNY